MKKFKLTDQFMIPVISFTLPENCPHRFICVSSVFRQQLACRASAPELIVSCWEHDDFKSMSQAEMQGHAQWINDSIALLKELCRK